MLLDANRRVVVTDFDIAQAMSRTHNCPTGGTLGFFAPEHLQGAPPAPAADINSLGCVLKWLLAKMSDQETPDKSALRQLAEQCQARDPAQRPTIDELPFPLRRLADAIS